MVTWEALDALSHQFELCKIDAATHVVVLHDRHISEQSLALVRAAITRTGAQAIEVAPTSTAVGALTRLGEGPLLPALIDSANVIINCLDEPGEEFDAMLEGSSCHVLRLWLGVAPQSYPPHSNLRRRVHALGQLANGSQVHITDANGTDLHIDLSACALTADHGFIGGETRNASFPAGWIEAIPARDRVWGELVVMPGDANITAKRPVASPLRLQIRDDHISVINGDNPDADVLRAQLEYPGEADAYGVAGLSIGLNPGSKPLVTFDERLTDLHLCRLAAGMVTMSFGHNLVADRPCSQVVTLALPGRTVQIDGVPVIIAGQLDGDFAPDVYER